MASPDPEIFFNVQSSENETVDRVDEPTVSFSQSFHSNVSNDDRRHDMSKHDGDDTTRVRFRNGPNNYSNNVNNSYDNTSRFTSCDQSSRQEYFNNRGDVQVPHRSHHATIMKPDTFDGTCNFELYASHFEDCAELSMWDHRTRVLMLAASLRGAARNFYMSLTENERRDYRALSTRLSNRFGSSSKHQCLWLDKLENRRRNKGESITSLADDLRQLAQKAYPDFDHSSQERLAVNHLYKLVSTEMKCRCMDNNCRTINEVVSVIERYESILGSSISNVRAFDSVGGRDEKPDIETMIKRIEIRLDKIESASARKSSTQSQQYPKTCFGCNALDHFWGSCPRNPNPRPRQNDGSGKPRHNNYGQNGNNRPYSNDHTNNMSAAPGHAINADISRSNPMSEN